MFSLAACEGPLELTYRALHPMLSFLRLSSTLYPLVLLRLPPILHLIHTSTPPVCAVD